MTQPVRPAVFIGSSTEALRTAEAIQVLLDRYCEVELWNQGAFELTGTTLTSLVNASNRFDFAILVVGPDDGAEVQGRTKNTPRDNVLFELGLFMGSLGPERTFMVFDRNKPPDLPSDLAGVTAATYVPHSSGNLDAALGAATTQIRRAIERLDIREARQAKGLTDAANSVRHSGARMERLVGLLARSRRVELEIIATQFGPMIDPVRLSQMRADLNDLLAELGPATDIDH